MEYIEKKSINVKWLLVIYDAFIAGLLSFLVLFLSFGFANPLIYIRIAIVIAILFLFRFPLSIYTTVWRFGGVGSYIRLLLSDFIAFCVFYALEWLLNLIDGFSRVNLLISFSIFGSIFILSLSIRLVYRYAYKNIRNTSFISKITTKLFNFFTHSNGVKKEISETLDKTNIAIIGAGRLGVSLAEELSNNINSGYNVKCFVDIAKDKVNKVIRQIPVYDESSVDKNTFSHLDIKEIVFALPGLDSTVRKNLFDKYKSMGFKIKAYDYPTFSSASANKHTLREFDVEELLFRDSRDVVSDETKNYYKDKIVMVTGGGGSIGSELARQLAKMSPKKIVIVDVYENGAYDVQQELRILYKNSININVEILSVTNKEYLEKVFKKHNPDIVIHAAAHKHVPLMETNCVEAIQNNVFGTLNTVDLAYKFKCERFIMVSTDKAVNPTNVMGATKRMCELIVQAYSTKEDSKTKFSATRFGNVLGSAGSVIPLFKKQIANGGPLTLTDKRIIRYFMTIPEAASLVLESGNMAKNGELFVLDMGKPIKILELAENIITLSGYRPNIDIKIEEIGLRPGEKLYEELLIKTENLDKTSHPLIFIEKDKSISMEQLNSKLDILTKAVNSLEDDKAKTALKETVDTFKTPEEVNKNALEAEEMKKSR